MVFVDPSGHDYELWHHDKYGELPSTRSYITEYGKDEYTYYHTHPDEFLDNSLKGEDEYGVFMAEAYCELVLHEDTTLHFFGGEKYGVAAEALYDINEDINQGEDVSFGEYLGVIGVIFTSLGGGEFGDFDYYSNFWSAQYFSRFGGGSGSKKAPEFYLGEVSEDEFLDAALNWLDPNYYTLENGRYVSFDGLWQVRYGSHETSGSFHHGHFEAYDFSYWEGGTVEDTLTVYISAR